MKIVISYVKCVVCGEERQFSNEYDTDDENIAKEMDAENLKHHIMDFYALHSEHQVEQTPIFKPCGQGDESKIRAAAAYCNWVIQNKYGEPTDAI